MTMCDHRISGSKQRTNFKRPTGKCVGSYVLDHCIINTFDFEFSGPIASVCINHLGLRNTTFAGGFISAVGLFASSFATDIFVIIMLFGAINGRVFLISMLWLRDHVQSSMSKQKGSS